MITERRLIDIISEEEEKLKSYKNKYYDSDKEDRIALDKFIPLKKEFIRALKCVLEHS